MHSVALSPVLLDQQVAFYSNSRVHNQQQQGFLQYYMHPQEQQYSDMGRRFGAVGFGRPLRSSTWNSPPSSPIRIFDAGRKPLLIGGRIGGQRRTVDSAFPTLPLGNSWGLFSLGYEGKYSRKVFVGGLPPDIDETEISADFSRFGSVLVDWPHKEQTRSYFPPKGYAFLIFDNERSVHGLISNCYEEGGKHYIRVSSPSIQDKAVQIRPWCLSDSDHFTDSQMKLDARKTVFVGGVPRPLKASELADIMERRFGGVSYAGVDTDTELKYPKGAGRVTFTNQQCYMAAIACRFVQLKTAEVDKNVEVKPYIFDDQVCDKCSGARCGNRMAPFFCSNVTCLAYLCRACWGSVHHSGSGLECHKPLIKDTADRHNKGTLPRWGMS